MKRVLAVDDSVSTRQLVVSTLKSAGYEVLEAGDGQDGLDMGRSRQVDLVLAGQNMPRMDGFALVKALRLLPGYKSIPILMLSMETSEAPKAQGQAAGASGWLVKPFDSVRLLGVVKKVIG
jgi:two-component system, chemotaxis family, chemotaxis protein CheY